MTERTVTIRGREEDVNTVHNGYEKQLLRRKPRY